MSELLTRWHKLTRRKQWLIAISTLVLVFTGIGALSGGSNDTAPAATAAVATETTEEALETEQDAEAVVEEEASAETAGQENARGSAEDYLDYSAFSRIGLIKQLKFEGYSINDATYAVDAVSPNWNEQAAKAAKAYLDYSSFSRSGLIEQLEFEGYTAQQAVYGVNQTGL